MKRHSIRRAVTFILAVLPWVVLGVRNRLYAQQTSNKEKADELIRSAQQSELEGAEILRIDKTGDDSYDDG